MTLVPLSAPQVSRTVRTVPAAGGLGLGVLLEGAGFPAVDEVVAVRRRRVVLDLDLGHEPAAVVAVPVAVGGDGGGVARPSALDVRRPVRLEHDVARGVAVRATRGVAIAAVRGLGLVERAGIGVPRVLDVAVRGCEGRLQALHDVQVRGLLRDRVEHGDRLDAGGAVRPECVGGRLRTGVLGHERDLVVAVEPLDGVLRGGGVGNGEAGVALGGLGEAEALALERVRRVLVLAGVDREAGGGVVEVPREDLVHLERDLDERLRGRVPAPAGEGADVGALGGDVAAAVDLRLLVVVVLALLVEALAAEQVGERRLRRDVAGDRPAAELVAGQHDRVHRADGGHGRVRERRGLRGQQREGGGQPDGGGDGEGEGAAQHAGLFRRAGRRSCCDQAQGARGRVVTAAQPR
ncbi:MAG: hypothetical protein LC779_03745 [Actinobacteria bacterium]|nr:hypothetical protein [Actinomycetota bacterium]